MDDKQYLERLGTNIITHRKAKEMTQTDLAGKLAIKYPMIGRIERGEVNCTINTLRKIAKALEISLSELVDI